MSRNIKVNILSGFTLVELLVSVAIIGIISMISIQMLYDGVTLRSKQYSLETSSESVRVFLKQISKAIVESKDVEVPTSDKILITGENICQTFSYDGVGKKILYSKVESVECAEIGSQPIMDPEIEIIDLSFSPIGDSLSVVNIEIEGVYKDSLGEHPINYKTSVSPRMTE